MAKKRATKKKATTPRGTDDSGGSSGGTGAGRQARPWGLDVPAYMATFSFLGQFEGLDTPFAQAGATKLSALRYWNEVGDGSRRTAAKALALRIDERFTEWLGAHYEAGIDFGSAISELFSVLESGRTRTVKDLADTADDLYRMRREAD
ncbi:hypothetical protein [Engelhardtia mirabilis]|uniref:Uncharacterized protein n=1 Tax=Engelhardtia mirabilis TaxID=2528011 RepID=A0A518BG84_9BACT|nr:hypothetical protein Pla133_10510 [Planctomycetes bacterium Pla133]QDV00311.1 hypothetical protein Pla86_10500 [Planctomycetes bacterium Pla86]